MRNIGNDVRLHINIVELLNYKTYTFNYSMYLFFIVEAFLD